MTTVSRALKNGSEINSLGLNIYVTDEFKKYLELAIKYSYKVNIKFSNKEIMDKLVKNLGDKINDPNELLSKLELILS